MFDKLDFHSKFEIRSHAKESLNIMLLVFGDVHVAIKTGGRNSSETHPPRDTDHHRHGHDNLRIAREGVNSNTSNNTVVAKNSSSKATRGAIMKNRGIVRMLLIAMVFILKLIQVR